jgi:archaemetzincin
VQGSRRWLLRGVSLAAVTTLPGVAWARRATRFEVPDEAARVAAAGSLEGVPEGLRPAFTAGADDLPVAEPRAGDWLAEHEEDGQTFARFKRERRHRPTSERRSIAVLPLGRLGEASPLAAVMAFGERYFGMPLVRRLTTPVETLGTRSRMHMGRRQYHTGAILDAMIRRVPDDAYCMIAVTMADLYPDPDWNFVFGQARLFQRVGVYSFARYDPAFHGEAHVADTPRLILRRSFKLLAHEVGHMFGAEHCIHYTCVMNGTNNLEETDRSPLHLCPVCLRKLHNSIGFDVAERERGLAEFYRAHGLVPEAEVAERRLARLVAARR